ncbi:hypothetical protein GCM10010246_43400 [Streptomyces cuspidosporus]
MASGVCGAGRDWATSGSIHWINLWRKPMEKQSRTDETVESYEPPALVGVGEFSEDTLGFGHRYEDVLGEQGWG